MPGRDTSLERRERTCIGAKGFLEVRNTTGKKSRAENLGCTMEGTPQQRETEYVCNAQHVNNRRFSKKKKRGRETVVGRNTLALNEESFLELKSPLKGVGRPGRAGGNGRE